jgi:SpoVK/Ycf46/Vps4 family AAA+-type ATPase
VDVELLDWENLSLAESVSIKLDTEKVRLWADDEVKKAVDYFLAQERVIYNSQKILLRPSTRDMVIGEINHFFPSNRDDLQNPRRIDKDLTRITFEGLPENLQKTIDFGKVGGLDHLIIRLREIILLPLVYPQIYTRFDIVRPKGMLLYGPPGNGKTMIAEYVAKSIGADMQIVNGPELSSKYYGETQRKWREVFENAKKQKYGIIFIDEIDSIIGLRDKSDSGVDISVVSTLLLEMDNTNRSKSANVFVIGATNRLNVIDSAMRRPGRFDLEFEIPIPNFDARLDILQKNINIDDKTKFSDNVNNDLLERISELTNGFSGADLNRSLKREIVMNAIRKHLSFDTDGKMGLDTNVENIKIQDEDFYQALKQVKPSTLRNSNIDSFKKNILWKDVLGFDHLKDKLSQIKSGIDAKITNEALSNRISYMNLIFKGKRGFGKKTMLFAFAKEFNLEVLILDMLPVSTLKIDDAFREIDDIFTKSKQVAPAIVYIRNLEKISSSEVFTYEILNNIDKLSRRHYVFVIVEIEETSIPKNLTGYKAFIEIIDFETINREAVLLNMGIDISGEILSLYANAPTGQIITELNEK